MRKFLKERRRLVCGCLIIGVIAVLIRLVLLGNVSGDYVNFLTPWLDQLRADGGIWGLANYTGNYNAPYVFFLALITYIPIESLFLIKGLSIVFDFIMAFGGVLIVRELIRKEHFDLDTRDRYYLVTFLVIMLFPIVIINSSYWGQCDSIYVSFAFFSILCLLKKQYRKAFIFLGLSFSIKLQAVFLLPLFGILYFRNRKTKDRFPFYYFFIIPLVDFIMCLPAVCFGWPIGKIVTMYFSEQVGYYRYWLSMSFPNFYNFISVDPMENTRFWYVLGVALTFILLMVFLILVCKKKIKMTQKRILELAILILTVVTYFLPGMHERYLFMGEVLYVIYFVVYRENKVLLATLFAVPLVTYFGPWWEAYGVFKLVMIGATVIYSVGMCYSWKVLYNNIYERGQLKGREIEKI